MKIKLKYTLDNGHSITLGDNKEKKSKEIRLTIQACKYKFMIFEVRLKGASCYQVQLNMEHYEL